MILTSPAAQPSPTTSRTFAQWTESAFGYAAIGGFVLLSYLGLIGLYDEFTSRVLPRSDPFTYAVGFFQLLDASAADYFGTIEELLRGERGSWYRLMNICLAVLSPVMRKDPLFISFVNYVIWGLGTAGLFRLGRHLGLGVGRAFALALIPWVWPLNYGFKDYSSLPVVTLDPSFNGALLLALASSFVFALNPRSRTSGIIAAVSIGLAVWGRGNSLPVVALVVGWPCLLAAWIAWRDRDSRAAVNVAITGVLALGFIIEFYAQFWGPLTTYYADHARFVERQAWNLQDAMPYIKYMPGIMMTRLENSSWTVALSWTSHVLVIVTAWLAWRRGGIGAVDRQHAYRQFAVAGALIYFGTYIADLAMFTDPLFTVVNLALVWRPMLIGLSLCLVVLIIGGLDRFRFERDQWLVLPLGALMLVWGVAWNRAQTPFEWEIGTPSPRVVERFATGVDSLLDRGGKVGILWYRNYNFPILRYYRLKNDLGDAPAYMGKYWDYLWSPSDYSEENRLRIRAEIKDHFENANLVIVPEYVDDYAPPYNFAFYHFRDDWTAWVNTPDAPRMRVRMILEDTPMVRVFVLQREEVAKGRGEPWRLPWGHRPATPPPDYSEAVIRFR
jgi:hypothetical protein